MAGSEIDVVGLNQLVKQLKSLEPELVDELKALNADLAEDVAGVARNLVPVLTGTLQQSIRAAGQAKTGVVRAGKTALRYAGPIHFGWSAHNIEPQPFLYDALDDRRTAVYDAYLAGVNKIVDKVH